MAYRVEIRPSVEKVMVRIRDERLQQRLAQAIDGLAENPRPQGIMKMSGYQNRYRLRVGDFRIIYEIHDPYLLVVVVAVGDRKEVYR